MTPIPRLFVGLALLLGAPPVAVAVGSVISGCSQAQCTAAQTAVTATANGINALIGAVKAWEDVASPSTGPTSCADPTAGPGDSTASIKVCIDGANCSTSSDVCEPRPADTSCNSCVRSKCCDAAVAVAGEFVAGCLIGCEAGVNKCGDTDIASATTFCKGGPDAAYDAMAACVTDKCDDVCAAFPWN
jgi:hypothetical protein